VGCTPSQGDGLSEGGPPGPQRRRTRLRWGVSASVARMLRGGPSPGSGSIVDAKPRRLDGEASLKQRATFVGVKFSS